MHDTDAIMGLRFHSTLAIVTVVLCDTMPDLHVPGLLQYGLILQCLLLSSGWMCETDATLYQFPRSESLEAMLDKASCRKLAPD
jgi:hypothetical protein